MRSIASVLIALSTVVLALSGLARPGTGSVVPPSALAAGPVVSGANVSVSKNVVVLNNATKKVLVAPAGGRYDFTQGKVALVFSKVTPQLRSLKRGRIIVSGPTRSAPYGMMRKVASLTGGAPTMVVNTTPASLSQVLTSGTIGFKGKLGQSGKQRFCYPIKKLQFIQAGQGITLNGNVCFTAAVTFAARLKSGGVPDVSFSIKATDATALGWQYTGTSFKFGKLLPLCKNECLIGLKPVVKKIGRVPLVMTPILTFRAGIVADLNRVVTGSITHTGNFAGTVTCIGGECQSRMTGNKNNYHFSGLGLGGPTNLTLFTTQTMAINILGVPAPTFNQRQLGKLTGGPQSNPCWALTGGFEADGGVLPNSLARQLKTNQVFVNVNKVLTQQKPPCPAAPNVAPIPLAKPTPQSGGKPGGIGPGGTGPGGTGPGGTGPGGTGPGGTGPGGTGPGGSGTGPGGGGNRNTPTPRPTETHARKTPTPRTGGTNATPRPGGNPTPRPGGSNPTAAPSSRATPTPRPTETHKRKTPTPTTSNAPTPGPAPTAPQTQPGETLVQCPNNADECLVVNPTFGSCNSQVQLIWQDEQPTDGGDTNAHLLIRFDSYAPGQWQTIGAAQADAFGNWEGVVTVPPDATVGPHTWQIDDQSDSTPTAAYTVTGGCTSHATPTPASGPTETLTTCPGNADECLVANPTSGACNSHVHLIWQDEQPADDGDINAHLLVRFDTHSAGSWETVATATADNFGNWQGDVSVPPDAFVGAHQWQVNDQNDSTPVVDYHVTGGCTSHTTNPTPASTTTAGGQNCGDPRFECLTVNPTQGNNGDTIEVKFHEEDDFDAICGSQSCDAHATHHIYWSATNWETNPGDIGHGVELPGCSPLQGDAHGDFDTHCVIPFDIPAGPAYICVYDDLANNLTEEPVSHPCTPFTVGAGQQSCGDPSKECLIANPNHASFGQNFEVFFHEEDDFDPACGSQSCDAFNTSHIYWSATNWETNPGDIGHGVELPGCSPVQGNAHGDFDTHCTLPTDIPNGPAYICVYDDLQNVTEEPVSHPCVPFTVGAGGGPGPVPTSTSGSTSGFTVDLEPKQPPQTMPASGQTVTLVANSSPDVAGTGYEIKIGVLGANNIPFVYDQCSANPCRVDIPWNGLTSSPCANEGLIGSCTYGAVVVKQGDDVSNYVAIDTTTITWGSYLSLEMQRLGLPDLAEGSILPPASTSPTAPLTSEGEALSMSHSISGGHR